MASSRPSSSRAPVEEQPLDDADIVQEMYRLLGNLTRSFVPATRKKREETKEERKSRKELKDTLDDMGYDIIELKAESSAGARRLDQDRVVDLLRRKISRFAVDGGYESTARFANLLSKLSNLPDEKKLRNLHGMLELFEALAYTAGDAAPFSTPAPQMDSRATSRKESRSTRYTDTPAETPASTAATMESRRSAPATNQSHKPSREASQSHTQRPTESISALPTLPEKTVPDPKGKSAEREPISSRSLMENGQLLTKTRLLQKFREHLDRRQVPEEDLLRDIIFILQGINGRYVKFEEVYQFDGPAGDANMAADARPSKVVRVLFSEEEGFINAPTKRIIHDLAELGQLYKRVSSFSQERASLPTSGLIMQSLCHFISNELTGFYRLIASLEAQMKASEVTTNTDSHDVRLEGSETSPSTTYVTLKRLALWTEEMTLRFRLMSTIIESCQDAHGGSLVSLIHSYTFNGDPFIRKFTSRLLDEVSKPFFHFLSTWIYEGELQDPFLEFFVELNDDPRNAQNRANSSGTDGDLPSFAELDGDAASLWQNKFLFRKEMLPSFLQESFGRKIFSTGKSLNFIRQSCGDGDWVATRHKLGGPVAELRYTDLTGLESTIEKAFNSASKRLLDIFLDDFKLMDHLRALKDYLMLSRGDFVDLLMSSLGPSLNRPANSLFRHNLTASLETAVRGSNAQYDDPDILRRLDARILEFSTGDTGWDTFTLEYKVDSPVNTVLDAQAMIGYQTIFSHLWKIKRVELALNSSWLRLHETGSSLRRLKSAEPALVELNRESQRSMLMLQEMIHFIRQMQGFAQLEVIEYSWDDLLHFFSRRQGDLDELIQSHRAYLNALIGKVLLRGGKRGSQDYLAGEVRAQFDTILAFTMAVDDLTHHATRELARHDMERGIQRSFSERGARSRTVSTTAASSGITLAPADPTAVAKITRRLKEQSQTFQDRMTTIVSALEKHANLTVRDLAVRLNFNARYEAPSHRGASVSIAQNPTATVSSSLSGRKKELAAAG